MNSEYLIVYEEINKIHLDNIINNKNTIISNDLIKKMKKLNINYSPSKISNIKSYSNDPTIKKFEKLVKINKIKLSELSFDEIFFLDIFIRNNVHYYCIKKNEKLEKNIFELINTNPLFIKFKDKIIFHLDTNIKGYRTIYLPLSQKCHIIGNYNNTLKDIIFIFHELGHCFQLLSNNIIYKDYTIPEFFACFNEILMSKETNFHDNVLKLINNKILESMCTYRFYEYLYSLDKFNKKKIEEKWQELCQIYNIKYKKEKWLEDFNSIENPQNILSYTIAYLVAFILENEDYSTFITMYDNRELSLEELLKIIQMYVKTIY